MTPVAPLRRAGLPPGFDLHRGYFHPATAGRLLPLHEMIMSLPFEQRTIQVFGRMHLVPRLTWYAGEVGYSYSGVAHDAAEIPEWLGGIMRACSAVAGVAFNSVLANLYRDGRDSVSWHADDEPELGERPTIASVSFGAARKFLIRERDDQRIRSGRKGGWYATLEHGDLLVMSGDSQDRYLHSVPKTRVHSDGPRLNLTFRRIVG